jgi:hypothetical protein
MATRILASALVCFVVVVAAAHAAVREAVDSGKADGPLQHHCLHLRKNATDASAKLQAILDLEHVQGTVTVWRVEWVASTVVAGFAAAACGACGACCSATTLNFLVAFLATMLAMRMRHSYMEAHILKHPSDARVRLAKSLLGLNDTSAHYYGTLS